MQAGGPHGVQKRQQDKETEDTVKDLLKSELAGASRGFTLMEMMVVVAILGVLMAIVAPAVTGTKGASVEGQAKSDATATQTATDNFNNKSVKSGQFPELALSATHARYGDVFKVGATANWDGSNVHLILKNQTSASETLAATITKPGSTSTVPRRTAVDFSATTQVFDSSGSVKTSTFVPDFLLKEPSSLILKGTETASLGSTNNTFEAYLWLFMVNAPGTDAESRVVQLFWQTAATCSNSTCTGSGDSLTYTQVY